MPGIRDVLRCAYAPLLLIGLNGIVFDRGFERRLQCHDQLECMVSVSAGIPGGPHVEGAALGYDDRAVPGRKRRHQVGRGV